MFLGTVPVRYGTVPYGGLSYEKSYTFTGSIQCT